MPTGRRGRVAREIQSFKAAPICPDRPPSILQVSDIEASTPEDHTRRVASDQVILHARVGVMKKDEAILFHKINDFGKIAEHVLTIMTGVYYCQIHHRRLEVRSEIQVQSICKDLYDSFFETTFSINPSYFGMAELERRRRARLLFQRRIDGVYHCVGNLVADICDGVPEGCS